MSIDSHALTGILDFLRAAEALKVTTRSGYTSDGQRESVAAHTWRVCLLAMTLAPSQPALDVGRLLRICIVHDLGEAVGGDIPAPEQARRIASGETGKAETERADLLTLIAPLPKALHDAILGLWDEYEAAQTPEARFAKAVDKLETILQHTQGANPPDFDYRFNLGYGRAYTERPEVIAELRTILDAETERRAVEAEQVPE